MRQRNESGFTAVELLVTLFVAAAFLIAGYQLFNVVIRDGGATRSEARASSIAYDYLRRYENTKATNPCVPSIPLSGEPVSAEGLTNATVSVKITCLPNATSALSKIEVTVAYNDPLERVVYSTLTNPTIGTTASDGEILNGMVAWWQLNGNANQSSGTQSTTVTNASPTFGQNGQSNTAYRFTGSNSQLITTDTPNVRNANAAVSLWVNSATASNSGQFIKIGNNQGWGVGIGNSTNFDNANAGTKIVGLFDNVRWFPTATDLGTGWQHIVMTLDYNGIPSIYRNGVLVGTYSGNVAYVPSGGITIGGVSGRWFNGSIDDVRIYNRMLSTTEITNLYNRGAK